MQSTLLLSLSRLTAAGALAFAGHAMAQNVTGIPPAPSGLTVTPPACEVPPTTAGLDPRPNDQKRWLKAGDAYQKCIKDYFKQASDTAQGYKLVHDQLVDAANKAVTEFNAWAEQTKKDADD